MTQNYRIGITAYIHKSITKWLACQGRRSGVSLFNCLTTLNFVLLVVYINLKNSKTDISIELF